MELPLLQDTIIIFALSIAVIFLCHHIRLPAIVGFLLTGVVVGPNGLHLIHAQHEVETLAELGVILLLFTIGIEFSFKNLLQIKKIAVIGGSLQVILTLLAAAAIAQFAGLPIRQAIFIGFLFSLSSTAIVLKIMQERAQIETPHGRAAIGILIFQDIAVVPMMLLTPLLAGAGSDPTRLLIGFSVKTILILLGVILAAKWVVPKLLFQITRTRNREIFLLSIVITCFIVAWVTSHAGLSLALGAFLAGLAISESPYSHQALGNILPFRDVFTSFFFVSIGMLLDVSFIIMHPVLILLAVIAVLILKPALAFLAVIVLKMPFRTALAVGLTLGQVGEFAFILSQTGLEHKLMTPNVYQVFLACSIITMAATPFIIAAAPKFITKIADQPGFFRFFKNRQTPAVTITTQFDQHLIIIGYGVNGQNVARAASLANIPYVIIEMNSDTVRTQRAAGLPIYYGDAAEPAVLKHLGIDRARTIVVAINDPAATRRITEMVRRLNPAAHIIARTRFVTEMQPLYQLGANEVIPEELETSIEIFTRVLSTYLVPNNEIESFVDRIRSDNYQMFRRLAIPTADPLLPDHKINLPNVEFAACRVPTDSFIIGRSLADSQLRNQFSLTLVAIARNTHIMANPEPNTKINTDDILYVFGSPAHIAEFAAALNRPPENDHQS